MQVIFLSVLLPFISLIRGYLIDDRDSAITYIPSSGSSAWIKFADAAAYLGTTTDNSCKTEQGCRFRFSFIGSGVSLTRFIITSIPIPLNATVTIDGMARPMILIPDGSPNVTVYDIQSLGYGSHSMEVTLMSYNGDSSHFRLDTVIINQTYPSPLSPSPTTTSTPTPAEISSPLQTDLPSRNVPVGVVIGGTLGGLAAVICMMTCLLLFVLKRRQTRSEKVSFDSIATGKSSPCRLTESPITTSPPLAILPTTSPTSTCTVATVKPGPQGNRYLGQDSRTPNFVTPPGSPTTYSMITSTQTGTQSSQCPSDVDVEFVTVRYRTRVQASDVVRIVESMPGEGGSSENEESLADRQLTSPAHDFKSA